MDDYLLAQHSTLEWEHWWFVARRRILADLCERWLPADDSERRILDLGCGAGSMLPILSACGSVIAADTSEDAIEFCRNRFATDDIEFAVGRVPEVLPGPATLDVVTAFDVIEHIPDATSAVASIADALKARGLFICTVPAYQWMWGPHDVLNHHQRRYTAGRLRASMEAAGLSVEWMSYFNTLLFPAIAGARLARKIFQRDAPASDFDVKVGPLNGLLTAVFASERRILRRAQLPFGVSIAAIARKP